MKRVRRWVIGVGAVVALAAGSAAGPGPVVDRAVAAKATSADEQVIRNVLDDCRISRERAREVALVRVRWERLDRSLHRRRGVVASFARMCRPGIVVQVLPDVSLAPLRAVLRRHRVARWTRFQRVRFTMAQLYGAQDGIEDRVRDLVFDCLVMSELDVPRNGVRVLVSTDASRAQLELVRRSAAASRVPTWVERIDATFCPDVER